MRPGSGDARIPIVTGAGATASTRTDTHTARRGRKTDWPQIVILYDMLLHQSPSPIARLNRAIWHALYADLLLDVGQRELARAADLRALQLTDNPGEQSLLRKRLDTDAC